MNIEHGMKDMGNFCYPISNFDIRGLGFGAMNALADALEVAIERTPESEDDESLIEEQTQMLRQIRTAIVAARSASGIRP